MGITDTEFSQFIAVFRMLVQPQTEGVFRHAGDEGGGEGVKLEEHCPVTDSGLDVLSQFSFETNLLA